MLTVNYKLDIGGWSVDSATDPRTEFVELETSAAIGSPDDLCRVAVYAPPAPQPGLLAQAAGAAAGALGLGGAQAAEAFAVEVRGQKIKAGDQIKIELTAGEVSGTVMTTEVSAVHATLGPTVVVGRSGLQKLARARVNQVYENQSLNQIVKDLAGQAQVATGDIGAGSTYPYFIAHDAKSLQRHIYELAAREDMDVYFDADNKLTLKKFDKTSADHTFYYGIDILDLKLFNCPMTSEHIFVYGESPVSKHGADSWHWLAKDLSPFRSEVGQGAQTLSIHDGVIRTKDAADTLAAAKYGALKDRATWGRLKILGNPKVRLADAVEIKNVPKPELNGLFKVAAVRHVFNKREGYLTYIGFTGQGGSQAAGGLLGQLGGQLAGALGL